MSRFDLTLDLKIEWVTVIYISWSSNFVLYLEDYLIYENDSLG